MLTIYVDYLRRMKKRSFRLVQREDLHRAGEIKEKAAISRLSVGDQTGLEKQMEEQKAVIVCDTSLFSAVTKSFFL